MNKINRETEQVTDEYGEKGAEKEKPREIVCVCRFEGVAEGGRVVTVTTTTHLP